MESENQQPDPTILEVNIIETTDIIIAQAKTQLRSKTFVTESLEKLKTDYENATIAGQSDKDGYKFVKEGVTKVRTIRTSIEKTRKELTEPALKFQRELKSEADLLTADLQKLEDSLKLKQKAYDDEKERLRLAAEKRFYDRTTSLFNEGFKFDSVVYALDANHVNLGVKTITTDEITNLDDDGWKLILKSVSEFKANVTSEETRIEAERLAAENKRLADEKSKEEELEKLRARVAELEKPVEVITAEVITPEPEPEQEIANKVLDAVLPTANVAAEPSVSQPGKTYTNTKPVWNAPGSIENKISEMRRAHRSQEYIDGFTACRLVVVNLMSDTEQKNNRAQWTEIFKSLQP